jgi:hypothetical protein
MIREHYLEDVLRQLHKYKDLAEKAVEQISDEELFQTLDAESNSIALVMKHLAGNMRSRWTDFLTSDGEKPDRQRDREFEREETDTRESLLASWEAGWQLTIGAISAIGWEDLEKTVTIRGEPHTVVEAINRQLTHYAYHVGQIVLLARHLKGADWRWLSIPKGKSREYEVSKEGSRYAVEAEGRTGPHLGRLARLGFFVDPGTGEGPRIQLQQTDETPLHQHRAREEPQHLVAQYRDKTPAQPE